MNWYIGQEIVCIKSHSNLAVIKGKIYTINGIVKPCCDVLLDVGITIHTPLVQCSICKGLRYANGDEWYLSESLFAPLMDISELTEILERKEEKV
jgi:hypothetical protein